MTIRDFLSKLLECAPMLDGEVYLEDEVLTGNTYKIVRITNAGTNDAVFITLEKEN